MPNEEIIKPYVPEKTDMPELTLKAILLGIVMAVILGAANAYLGLKAGITIGASFPAAVIAIAAFRLPFFRGSILEQNIARTAASVGEALVAGAIFTIPAFVMVTIGGERLWTDFHYWETSIILLVGGILGILFIILLRRTLVVDADLPYPEGWACFEIVKAGQKGDSGAKYVFGSLGIAVLIELLKNPSGIPIFQESKKFILSFPKSIIHHFNSAKESIGDVAHQGAMVVHSPLASPAFLSVGYIIGPRLASLNFAGGLLAWVVLIPLVLFLDPDLGSRLSSGGEAPNWSTLSYTVWYNIVRPIAVGAMLVGSLNTLWKLRKSLGSAFSGIFSQHEHAGPDGKHSRLEKDLNLKWVSLAALGLVIPMFFVYLHFSQSMVGAIAAAVVMLITGFLFSAVGGWLVGIVGNSSQPVSGLTLSTLIVAALVMLAVGVTGLPGVAAVLGVASIVCCAACLSGDMIQDLKVGQLVGGTPWKMEVSEMISVVVTSFVLIFPIIILHKGNIALGGIGIGGTDLPAPQAGLMAQLAVGMVGGSMPWALIIAGMFLGVALIVMQAGSPMLVAVGMYLPFKTSFAIFVGGVIKWILDAWMDRKKATKEEKTAAEGKGILIASGFIAGEALTGVIVAGLILLGIPSLNQLFFGVDELPLLENYGTWLSLVIFGLVGYALIKIPSKR